MGEVIYAGSCAEQEFTACSVALSEEWGFVNVEYRNGGVWCLDYALASTRERELMRAWFRGFRWCLRHVSAVGAESGR